MEHKCVTKVFGYSFMGHSCNRPGKVERGGKWYCGIHDPVKIAERLKKRDEKWEQERAYKQKQYELQKEQRARDAVLNKFCEGVPTELLIKWGTIKGILVESKGYELEHYTK